MKAKKVAKRVYKFKVKEVGSILRENFEIEADNQIDALRQLADIYERPMAGMIEELKMEFYYEGVKVT